MILQFMLRHNVPRSQLCCDWSNLAWELRRLFGKWLLRNKAPTTPEVDRDQASFQSNGFRYKESHGSSGQLFHEPIQAFTLIRENEALSFFVCAFCVLFCCYFFVHFCIFCSFLFFCVLFNVFFGTFCTCFFLSYFCLELFKYFSYFFLSFYLLTFI